VVDGLSVTQKERVVHIGPFDETEKGSIFDAFDVLALPSKEESFGIAYLEAWACRKPVIGARTGPIRCVVDEGIDGLLVDPDDADDIARAIIELLSDSNMRERMGRSGHAKTVTHYTWDKIIDRVERLYVDLVAVRAANRPWLMIPKRSSSQI
jgi:glycosyltransferase involved in cell wall biosynthesis